MKLNLTVVFLLCIAVAWGQIPAITQTGDEVILYDDGTWEYAEVSSADTVALPINPKKFTRSSGGYLVKSGRTNIGIYIDKKWQQVKGKADAEYTFRLKDQEAYGILITERIHVPVEQLADLAFVNARNVAGDAKIVEKEYRFVNDKQVIYMRMNARIQGIDFVYLGYYYSDESGSTQLLMYTGQSLFDEYRSKMEEFMNGFVVNP